MKFAALSIFPLILSRAAGASRRIGPPLRPISSHAPVYPRHPPRRDDHNGEAGQDESHPGVAQRAECLAEDRRRGDDGGARRQKREGRDDAGGMVLQQSPPYRIAEDGGQGSKIDGGGDAEP